MDHVNKLFVHASQDNLYSTTPSFSSSPKTCALQTIRTQQSLSLHNFSLTLDLERTCLLMEISRYHQLKPGFINQMIFLSSSSMRSISHVSQFQNSLLKLVVLSYV